MVMKPPELIGKKIGKLAIIGEAATSIPGKRIWVCRCDCGVVREMAVTKLTKACSMWCARGKTRTPFTRVLAQYKRDASVRNLSWELTDHQFEALILSRCHYTGRLPSKSMKCNGKLLIYNGIDRLDNSIGYTWENCVPCCHEVNMMKKNLPYSVFVSLCKEVARPKIKMPEVRGVLIYEASKSKEDSTTQ